MKKQLLIALAALLISASPVLAAEKSIIAYTDLGEEVLLSADQTWVYGINRTKGDLEIFHSKATPATLEYDPKTWRSMRKKINPAAEMNLIHVNLPVYIIGFFEAVQIDEPKIKTVFLNNILATDPNAKAVEQYPERINNVQFHISIVNASIKGLEITYFAAVTSVAEGTFQVVGFSAATEFEKLRPSYQKALEGFKLNKK